MENNQTQTPETTTGQNVVTQNTGAQPVDYDKIQGMIDSRNQRNEDAILKSYFQKQGLSEEEMNTAIQSFKTKREQDSKQQKVDNENLQNQLKDKDAVILKQNIEHEALLQSLELGVDKKTIPYLIKLADFSGVIDEKNNVNGEKVKEALNKVLTDVPSLRKTNEKGTEGVQVGADTTDSAQPSGNLFNFGFTGVRKH